MVDRPSYERYGEAIVHSGAEPVGSSSLHALASTMGSDGGLGSMSEAHSRLMSPRPRSDASGPAAGRLRFEARSGSTPQRTGPYLGALAAAKAAQESAILGAVRRQQDTLEQNLLAQIARVQQQGDRLRDAAFTRVDAKMGTMETQQPKFDRKLAELSGNYKGLSDEMQAQIRRIDQMDTRFWEWRHQLEDEVRTKFAEVEQGQKQANSAIRLASATNEDSLKRINNRLRRLEGLMEERLGYSDDTNHSLAALDARLQEIEAARIQDLAVCTGDVSLQRSGFVPVESLSNGDSFTALEAKLVQACLRIDQVEKGFQEAQTHIQTQEERLRSMRTQIDSKEESYRLSKFDRQDWETRSKELHHVTQELDKHRIEHSERLEVFQRRFEYQEKASEEVCDQIRRLQERAYNLAAAGAMDDHRELVDTDASTAAAMAAATLSLDNCAARLDAAEQRLDDVSTELGNVRSDAELAPRVAALVETLKLVAPKVMDQEMCVRELHEKVGHLEAKAALSAESGKVSDIIVARVGRLEVEVGRLRSEVEGSEMPEAGGNHAVEALDTQPGAKDGQHIRPARRAFAIE